MNSIDIQLEKNSREIPSVRSLVVADDHKIRTEMFSATASILKKIKKLESDHEAFVVIDQRLFEDWYNLTFRPERHHAELVERRHQTLSTFKIHLVYLAETSNISFAEAYQLLKEEELQYQNGDDDWKFIIEKLRQHRLEYAKKARENSQSENLTTELPLEEAQESLGQPDISRLNRKSRSLYYYSKEVNDETLHKLLTDPVTGYGLFKEVFQIVMECGDWSLLARLWKNSNDHDKTKMLKTMPLHLMDFLNQMMSESSAENSKENQAAAEIELKSVFRRLARALHPDMHQERNNEDFKNWSGKILQQAQKAYSAQDLPSLKRLEFITVVQLGDLNSLTLDEIYESSLIFAEELEKLKKNLRAFEKHPAWRFSSRRSYNSLAAKIRTDLKRKIMPISTELEHLEKWLSELEETNPGIQRPPLQ